MEVQTVRLGELRIFYTVVLFKVDVSFLILSTTQYLTFSLLRIIIMQIPEHVRKSLENDKTVVGIQYSIFNLFNSTKSITSQRNLLDLELAIIHYIRHYI
jgi:hypothetical protein